MPQDDLKKSKPVRYLSYFKTLLIGIAGIATFVLGVATFYYSFLHKSYQANITHGPLTSYWKFEEDDLTLLAFEGDYVVSNTGSEPFTFNGVRVFLRQIPPQKDMSVFSDNCEGGPLPLVSYHPGGNFDFEPLVIGPDEIKRFRFDLKLNQDETSEYAAVDLSAKPIFEGQNGPASYIACLEALLLLPNGEGKSPVRLLSYHTAGRTPDVLARGPWQIIDE